MTLQIYYQQAPFTTWSKTSFDHIRDFSQPPPPGVNFANALPLPNQQHNVSTRLPQSLYNNTPTYTSQIPYATAYTSQQSYANNSYAGYSMISLRNGETINPMSFDTTGSSESNTIFQPDFFSSSSKNKKSRKRKRKLASRLASMRRNRPPKCIVNNNKSKKAPDNDEDESIIQIKKEVGQKFYQEKTRAELKVKKQRSIEVVKQEPCDRIIRPIFPFSHDRQPSKNDESICIAMKLPLEIFIKIVEYSTAETTLALTFTCQKWYYWLTDEKSAYINCAWRRSRKNTHPRRRKPKNGVCEMFYTIQKMKPKPEWYFECDMCYKKSNIMKWIFRNKLVKTCYNCMKMYEESDKQVKNRWT